MHIERWEGWGDEVASISYVHIDMDSHSTRGSSSDVGFSVSESVALELRKGEHVAFTGNIEKARVVLGSPHIRLEDVALMGNKWRLIASAHAWMVTLTIDN